MTVPYVGKEAALGDFRRNRMHRRVFLGGSCAMSRMDGSPAKPIARRREISPRAALGGIEHLGAEAVEAGGNESHLAFR